MQHDHDTQLAWCLTASRVGWERQHSAARLLLAACLLALLIPGGNKYSGPLAAAADILRHDGPGGFLKGWLANYTRLGPQTVVIFIVNEKLREVFGMRSL